MKTISIEKIIGVYAMFKLTPWPKIRATSLCASTEYASAQQPGRVVSFLRYLRARKLIDAEILDAVGCYTSAQIPLLSLAGRDPEFFLRLHGQSPALTMALAGRYWERPALELYPCARQRDYWNLVFPGSTASFARQMARIPAHVLSLPVIGFLAGRWQSRWFRRIFRHRATMSPAIMRCFLEFPDEALEPRLLSIVEREDQDPSRAKGFFNSLLAYPLFAGDSSQAPVGRISLLVCSS